VTSFSFVHTADIHLHSPLKGLVGYDGPAAERIRSATGQEFDNLIGEAIEEKSISYTGSSTQGRVPLDPQHRYRDP
jgi:hypothetical protein